MLLIETAAATSACRIEASERVGRMACAALLEEIATWPKPGLVSYVDTGSHRDMDAGTFERSAAAICPFYIELARTGERIPSLTELRRIGVAAEAAMVAATDGVNVHRGAIFSLGLLCAAEGARRYAPGSGEERAHAVRALWGEAIMDAPTSTLSHGGKAARRFGVGGARIEAGLGFPTVIKIGLPALHAGRSARPDDRQAASVHCFFSLLAKVEDTNLLHRGGAGGLRFAKAAAAHFMAAGGVAANSWLDNAERIHRAFVERNLSPGGSADLLAATLFLDALDMYSC